MRVWSAWPRLLKPRAVSVRTAQKQHPRAIRGALIAAPTWSITVPALVCANLSDHSLHSRDSFEGYRRIASGRKWLLGQPRPGQVRSPGATGARSGSGSLPCRYRTGHPSPERPEAWCAKRFAHVDLGGQRAALSSRSHVRNLTLVT